MISMCAVGTAGKIVLPDYLDKKVKTLLKLLLKKMNLQQKHPEKLATDISK